MIGGRVMSTIAPTEIRQSVTHSHTGLDRPWLVIVWDDPVNLMSYVVFVFRKLFGYSTEHATKLMLDVHNKGKAVVSEGSKEKAELDVLGLHKHGLWATMQQAD